MLKAGEIFNKRGNFLEKNKRGPPASSGPKSKLDKKQPLRGILRKQCSENMQ